MIDLNKTSMKVEAVSKGVAARLDSWLIQKRRAEPRRDYLGASAFGHECDRAIQYEYAGFPREREMTPDTLRKIAFGHLTEAWAYQEFRDAGFALGQHNRLGILYSFSQMGGKFKGHPDGVFVRGPEIEGVGYPCLWEHKGVGSKTYKMVASKGLKKARPGYYTQLQLYMTYLELTDHPAIITFTNLDTGEQMHLPIPYDAEAAQKGSDRAVKIIKATDAEELLPRAFANSDHFVCKGMCDFAGRCWKRAS